MNNNCKDCKVERVREMKFKYISKGTIKLVDKIKEILLKGACQKCPHFEKDCPHFEKGKNQK